jgi:hypothetical protein
MEDHVFFCLMELCRIKEFDRARTKYYEFIAINGGEGITPRQLSWLAKIEGLSGNTVQEIEILSDIIDKFPDYYSAQFMAARALLKIDNFQQAIKFGRATLIAEASLAERPFSKSAAFLIAFAAMKLQDNITFETVINQFDDNHTEWLEERLWTKKDLAFEIRKNR